MFSRFGLKTILIAGAIVIAVIPAAVLGVGSAAAIRNLTTVSMTQRYELLAKGLASEYEQFAGLHLRAITTLAAHAAGLKRLSTETLSPILAQTRPNYPSVTGITVVDAAGKTIARDPPLTPEGKNVIGADLSDREWFKTATRTKRPLVEREVVASRFTGQIVVVLAAPILDSSGRVRGVVVSGIDLRSLRALNDRVRFGTTGRATAATERGSSLTIDESTRDGQEKSYSRLPIWSIMTARESGQIPSYTDREGKERLGGFATVPGVGWKIWVSQTASEVLGEILAAYRRVLGWVLLSLLATLGIAVVFAVGVSRPIQQAAGDTAAASSEILAATAQQASGAAEEAAAVQETSTTVDEVKRTAQVATRKAQAVTEAVQRTVQVSQEGRRAVEESVRGMQEAKTRMEGIAERILALSERGQAIGEIIATVNDVAEQSNLLAVNAAIEAAKAGEAGRGFAVVAAEVKVLAEQSKQATAQVRGILNEIQRATQGAVMAAEQGVKVSEASVTIAAKAGDAIRLLAEGLTESAQAAQQILVSAQQQATGMDQVGLAMHNIQQASAQNMASTRQVERAAQDLNALSRRLQALVAPSGNGRA